MSSETFTPTPYVQKLGSVKSAQRHGIYNQFLADIARSPQNLVAAVTQPDLYEGHWGAQLQSRLSIEKIQSAFSQSSLPNVGDFTTLINSFDTEAHDSMGAALKGYFDQPWVHLKEKPQDPAHFWNECRQAIQLGVNFATAILLHSNAQQIQSVMAFFREDILLDAATKPSILHVLRFAECFAPDDTIASDAGMITLLLDNLDVQASGMVQPIDQAQMPPDYTHQLMALTGQDSLNERQELASETTSHNIEQAIGSLFQTTDEKDQYQQVRSVTLPPAPSTLAQLAEDTYIQTQIHYSNDYLDRTPSENDVPDSQLCVIMLPGGGRSILRVFDDANDDEFSGHVRGLIVQQIEDIQKGAVHLPIHVFELALMFNYIAPEFDQDRMDAYISSKKEASGSGLYGISRRGISIVPTDEVSPAIGIQQIIFKKARRLIVGEIDVLGTRFSFEIDQDMNISLSNMPEPAGSWLQSIIFTYLNKVRQGEQPDEHADVNEIDHSTHEDTPSHADQTEPGEGVGPYLRVLPLRQKYHPIRTSIDPLSADPVSVDANKRARDEFGYSLGELNTYFGLAQTDRKILDELPPALRYIINGLLQRIVSRETGPTWVNEWEFRGVRHYTPLMILSNPPNPQTYHPLLDVYSVTFVDDFTNSTDAPVKRRFSDVSFAELYTK